MTLDRLDQTLARLRGDADAIGANVLELDADPNRTLLEGATLHGQTAERWAEANRDLTNMWALLTRFNALLDQATEMRGTRSRLSQDQERRLEMLLTGASIELERAEVPLRMRAATGGREATSQCSPDELLTAISDAFDRAKEVIFGVAEAWETLIPRLRAAQAAVDEATQAGVNFGDSADPELTHMQQRVDELGDLLVMDPLAADRGDIDALEAEIAGLRAKIDDATQLRDDIGDRIERARELLDELRGVAVVAKEAHRNATMKIASPRVPAPSLVGRGVGEELERVIGLVAEKKWRTAHVALEEWTTTADALLRATNECTAANLAPIEERNQLRGRLDAYRAKAYRLGLIEDPDVSARYDEAHVELYTAPTDLAKAAELVRRYQEALPGDSIDRRAPM